jgi:small neutral amino acid transporter SnatA (MarC family)
VTLISTENTTAIVVFALIAYLAAVNPPRLRIGLPQSAGRARFGPLLAGAALVFILTAGLAIVAEAVLDWFQITPESWRMATGIIVGLVGARVLVAPQRADEPVLDGWGAALVPVAFPLLFTPQLATLAMLFGSTESTSIAVGMLALALVVVVAVGMMRRTREALWLASARFFGAVLIIVAVLEVVEGIRDV